MKSIMFRVQQFLFLALLISSFSSEAQMQPIGSPSVTNFSRSQYQAGTQNWHIAQDRQGLMYFGNNKGLLEYDGTSWQTFELPNRTIVRSFAFGDDGKIYIGGQNEIGYFAKGLQGKMEYVSITDKIPEGWDGFDDVWKIFVRPDEVWFCSERAVFVYKDDAIKAIGPHSGRFENFFEVGDSVFLQDKSKGLFIADNGALIHLSATEILSDQRIVTILPYDGNQLLLITVSAGMYLLGTDSLIPWNTSVSDFLISNQAYCAIKLSDGRYAIGTSQNGVVLMTAEGNASMHLNVEKGLQNNTVLSIFQDVQKNLWMGLDNGIDYAEISSPFSIIRSETGIKGTGYASIIYNDHLYLGTNQGLYYSHWSVRDNLGDQSSFKPVENALGQVWNINELGKGVVVSQHKGAAYLRDDRVEQFSSIQGAWKFMALKTYPGYAIEGTYTGLILYKNENAANPEEAPLWTVVKKLEGFNESARVFEEDAECHIWVSHAYKGLYRLKLLPDSGTIASIEIFDKEKGLPVELFINVARIRNEIVFTTPAGIYTYDKETERFVVHKDLTNIFGESRNVHRLIEDQLGNVWFSIDSDFGVLKVNDTGVVNKLEIAYFNQIQEELVDGFEHIYAYDSNNVFIGTERGFVHFNPTQKPLTGFPFGVLIRQVTLITSSDSVLYWGYQGGYSEAESPKLSHNMNDFRFDFTAPYYEKSSMVLYRYKLEGFDQEWSEWTSKTQKEYTNLTYGTYKFIAQARNGYGEVSGEASYSFSISPPWYATPYARTGYLLFAMICLLGIVKIISKREKRKTEAFKREQTEKLQKKEAEFRTEVEKSEGEIVSLRNEKLRADINHKNSQLASATMHLVQKSEILIKLKNDLTVLTSEAPFEFRRKIEQINRAIESDIQLDNNWEQFEVYFDQVHENFFKRLRQKFPELTPKDQKLCAYLRMNLSTKEIAPLLNISVRGVEISRYRVRKKLGIDSDTNLVEFIMDV